MITLNELYDAQIDKAGWRRQPRTVQFGFGSQPRVREKVNTGEAVNTGRGELIDPMDRELGRNSGFKILPGGNIGYSVADDEDKLMGQALAEYDARRNSPRYDYYKQEYNPADDPEALRHELLDPISQRFGRAFSPERTFAPAKEVQPRIVKSGPDVFMLNPDTDQLELLHQGAAAPVKLTEREKSDLTDIENEITANRTMMMKQTEPELQKPFRDRLLSLDKKRRALFAPKVATADVSTAVTPTVVAPPPSGFIGDVDPLQQPTGPNAFVPPQPATNPPSAIQGGLVDVINPKGKATKIKATDLERALKEGYKQR